MLLKQMGSISIPLLLSPAAKLLMDHAKLTVSYSKDWLAYGCLHKLCRVIWGHFLVSEGKWNHSVPGCWSSIWSAPVFAQEAQNLPCAVLLWCPGLRQLSACVHPLRTLQLLSDQRFSISQVFCPPFSSSLAQVLLYILNVTSNHTTQNNQEMDQNACEYTLTGEMGYVWKWNQDYW